MGRIAMASTRKAWEERSSTTFNTSDFAAASKVLEPPDLSQALVQRSKMKLGAPLQIDNTSVSAGILIPFLPRPACPGALHTVTIILREEENGISRMRLCVSDTSDSQKPSLAAATTIGASDEFPLGDHVVVPSTTSFSSLVLQQSRPANKVDRTTGSWLALTVPGEPSVFAFVKHPTVGSKPFPETSYISPPAKAFTMVILPSVKVPVLSVQMTDAEPKVSTAARRRTNTFFSTMAEQPFDKEIVTQSGIPSGMAATAKVTAIRIIHSQLGFSGLSGSLVLSANPTTKTTVHTPMAIKPMLTPSFWSENCRGV